MSKKWEMLFSLLLFWVKEVVPFPGARQPPAVLHPGDIFCVRTNLVQFVVGEDGGEAAEDGKPGVGYYVGIVSCGGKKTIWITQTKLANKPQQEIMSA